MLAITSNYYIIFFFSYLLSFHCLQCIVTSFLTYVPFPLHNYPFFFLIYFVLLQVVPYFDSTFLLNAKYITNHTSLDPPLILSPPVPTPFNFLPLLGVDTLLQPVVSDFQSFKPGFISMLCTQDSASETGGLRK